VKTIQNISTWEDRCQIFAIVSVLLKNIFKLFFLSAWNLVDVGKGAVFPHFYGGVKVEIPTKQSMQTKKDEI